MYFALKKPRTFVEHLINLLSGCGGYCHSELIFVSTGRALSSFPGGGVQWVSHTYPPDEWDLWDIGYEWAEDFIVEWAEREIGSPYDFAGVARFVLKFLRQSRTAWFCSEIDVTAVQQCNVFRSAKPWKVSPNRVAKMLKRAKFRRVARVPLTSLRLVTG